MGPMVGSSTLDTGLHPGQLCQQYRPNTANRSLRSAHEKTRVLQKANCTRDSQRDALGPARCPA